MSRHATRWCPQEVLTAMEGVNRTHMAGSPGRMKWLGCYCISALPGLNVSLCKGIQWHDLSFMMFIEYFKIVFVFNWLVHFFLHWIPLAGTGSVWGPEAHDPADWRGSCSATGSQARGPRQSPSTLSLQSPFEIFWAMCYRCGWDLKTRICWNLEVLILKHL